MMAERRKPRLSPMAGRLAAGGQSSAWAIADEVLRRTSLGEPLLLLTLGDPVCPPHPAIVAATKAALDAGRTHYTPLLGELALRDAIARREGADAANVAVVPGAQHACYAALALLAGEGDEVILSDPYYATYPGAVAATGARAVMARARPDLSIDIDAIAAAITPATRVIFLNSPANPSGAALSVADYARLSDLAETRDLWLMVDEVYASFGFGAPPPRAWAHGPKGRTIVVNSLSKSHAMTGYRIGWVLAPEEVTVALGDWSAAALFGVSQFVQDAALEALGLPEAELADYHGGFAKRAALVVERANAIPGLKAAMPAGGMFVMIDCRGVEADDVAFAYRLLEKTGVATMPASGFGDVGRGHLRISLTPDAATLEEAFDRIAQHLRRG
ncbi:pyridoxal phosphate-dependent aminotransferase [Sandaracinobacter sp. RS1-74]|uniref:pyridoxal phosphate-dependent aminotransferase n=1 Tax=Sandaracinobacteroides sayramensis TaxID=2913411 RepID=UPI001EDA4AC2|nr:pyridoxal phosphate-dependent aminotransferase [Sandaracinobacteroides sayramensis]MCG2840523.1 pyridoxal phosphate-dependent aminotransferase [Sandaracinobacteroides sayramensis]